MSEALNALNSKLTNRFLETLQKMRG